MMNGYDGLSPSDVALLTNRNNDNGGFGGDGWWAILLLLALGGFGGGFGFGGMGGFGGAMGMYPWIANGQQDIIANTNTGFDTLHLSNQLDTINSGIYSLSNQLCNCCADMSQTVANGFYNSEISANNRQMANMNQNFQNQIATLNGFNGLQKSLDNCCCENRLATQDLKATVISENCADREALSNGIRDIISSNTSNTQAILDKLCQQEIDAKNETIANLRTQLNMADLRASQTAQTAELRLGQEREVDALYNRLASCPVGTMPVYGNQPIFTCPNNNNYNGCGCGCGNNNF